MAVMHAPRSQAARRHEHPVEPGTLAGLLELRDKMDTGKRRAEIIEGRLVVSPVPVLWHELACQWLTDSLSELCKANGWLADRNAEIDLPPTRDRIEPDVLVLTDAKDLPQFESVRPLGNVLLVAEVVSQSSIRDDREVKPHACALAGVPLYLLVDRFTDPLTVSVHSEPGPDGYASVQVAEAGAALALPAPLEIALGTAALPLPD